MTHDQIKVTPLFNHASRPMREAMVITCEPVLGVFVSENLRYKRLDEKWLDYRRRLHTGFRDIGRSDVVCTLHLQHAYKYAIEEEFRGLMAVFGLHRTPDRETQIHGIKIKFDLPQ